jgi:hypothetical protein
MFNRAPGARNRGRTGRRPPTPDRGRPCGDRSKRHVHVDAIVAAAPTAFLAFLLKVARPPSIF